MNEMPIAVWLTISYIAISVVQMGQAMLHQLRNKWGEAVALCGILTGTNGIIRIIALGKFG